MKPPVETIRLGKQARDHLVKIRRNTGIENWNIICRWALCVSLREQTPPPVAKASSEDGVEMTWKVFGGDYLHVYEAILGHHHAKRGGNKGSFELGALLHAHIRRGLSYLSSGTETRSIEMLISKWLQTGITSGTPTGDANQGT